MAGNKARKEILCYAIVGAVILAGTIALMLFGAKSRIADDIGPLIAGLALSLCAFRFGLPWKWMYFPFLASFFVVGILLGQPGLMWMGGYVAGVNLGVAWRMAVVKPKVKAKWEVNGRGIDTLAETRKVAQQHLRILDGERHRHLVVEHGSARFEVAGSLPSKLVCHRTNNAESDFLWAVLENPEPAEGHPIEVPMWRVKGSIPSRFVNEVSAVEAALLDFLKNPKAESLGPEWNTDSVAFDVRLNS